MLARWLVVDILIIYGTKQRRSRSYMLKLKQEKQTTKQCVQKCLDENNIFCITLLKMCLLTKIRDDFIYFFYWSTSMTNIKHAFYMLNYTINLRLFKCDFSYILIFYAPIKLSLKYIYFTHYKQRNDINLKCNFF